MNFDWRERNGREFFCALCDSKYCPSVGGDA